MEALTHCGGHSYSPISAARQEIKSLEVTKNEFDSGCLVLLQAVGDRSNPGSCDSFLKTGRDATSQNVDMGHMGILDNSKNNPFCASTGRT